MPCSRLLTQKSISSPPPPRPQKTLHALEGFLLALSQTADRSTIGGTFAILKAYSLFKFVKQMLPFARRTTLANRLKVSITLPILAHRDSTLTRNTAS